MKESDISFLEGSKHTLTPPSPTYFRGQDPQLPGSAPLHAPKQQSQSSEGARPTKTD